MVTSSMSTIGADARAPMCAAREGETGRRRPRLVVSREWNGTARWMVDGWWMDGGWS